MRQEQVNFDTYKHVKDFEKAGFATGQAEALVSVISASREFDISRLATKEQLTNVEEKLIAKIDGVEDKLAARIDGLEEKLTAKIDGVEDELTARIDGLEEKLTAKIDGVEDKLTARIDGLEEKLTAKINTSQAEVIAILKESMLGNLRWQIGMMASVMIALIGLAYKLFPH